MLGARWLQTALRGVSTSCSLGVQTTSCQQKGHSKWQNIKATKGKNDMIKSQATNQLLRKAKAAALKGGFDIKINRDLATVEQEFKAQGLAADTLKNFLQKLKDKPEVECRFDVIGPGGTFFIVVAETDNKKTFENTLRKYFNKIGGFRLATDASGVGSWFSEKGIVTVNTLKKGTAVKLEEMEEAGIEVDCEEVNLIDEEGVAKFELICEPSKLSHVENELTKLEYAIESAEIEFRPLHPVAIEGDDAGKVEKFYEYIQEDENTKQIFDNIQPDA